MNFRFETDYDLDTLTAMAKGLRRTVRKKRSRRVHVFAAITFLLCACGLLERFVSAMARICAYCHLVSVTPVVMV